MQGDYPSGSLAFIPPRGLKDVQSIPITIKCKHFTYHQKTNRIWTNEKAEMLWRHEKGIQQPRLPLQRKHREGCSGCGHTSVALSSSRQILVKLQAETVFCDIWGKDGQRQKRKTRMCTERGMKSSPLLDCWDDLDGGH